LSGLRTLIISTDPASSLGDAFAVRLSATPRRIPLPRGVLHGLEIDAARALGRWLAGRRAGFERIAVRGTWLDREDVSALLRLSLPGVDELAALLEMTRLAGAGRYDRIVVDTAPTGHTLRMLMMPESLRAIARVFDLMQAKHRVVVEALRGAWVADEEDALIDEIERTGRDLDALLRDGEAMHVTWVALPESMAVEETADAVRSLQTAGIAIRDVIVNQLTPSPVGPCRWCDSRRRLERGAVADLRSRVSGIPLIGVASRAAEPRGVRALAGVGREIALRRLVVADRSGPRRGVWRAPEPAARGWNALSLVAGAESRLILFGGKGGVGKTTCAAAAALALASRSRDRRVTLLSTDPAHSLADVFGTKVSDSPARLPPGPPNLLARELDASARFREIRGRYAAAIDALFDRLSRDGSGTVRVDAGQDRRVMHGLIDLAPPGIDELAAVIEVIDAIDVHSTDLVIMDTAPTGHALRLLEMPGLVQDWVKALMSILLKYQPIIGVGELGAVLLRLSQGLGRLRTLLAESRHTSFIIVTRPAALPRVETIRLMKRLHRLQVNVPWLIVNATGRGTCTRCRAVGRAQQREISQLARLMPKALPVVIAPVELPPPYGPRALLRWQQTWRLYTKHAAVSAISSKRIT
jgi:arsenite-transporting ATPase